MEKIELIQWIIRNSKYDVICNTHSLLKSLDWIIISVIVIFLSCYMFGNSSSNHNVKEYVALNFFNNHIKHVPYFSMTSHLFPDLVLPMQESSTSQRLSLSLSSGLWFFMILTTILKIHQSEPVESWHGHNVYNVFS